MNRKKTIVILAFLFFFLLSGAVLAAYQLVFWRKIYFGVKVAGQNLAGLDMIEAAALIEKKVSPLADKKICLKAERESWCFAAKNIGVRYYPRQTANRAFSLGRESDSFNNLKEKFRLLSTPADINLSFSLDQSRLDSYIATVSSQMDRPFLPPMLIKKSGLVTVVPGRQGRRVDVRNIKDEVNYQLGKGDFKPIAVHFAVIGDHYSAGQLNKAKQVGQRLVGKSIILSSGWQNFVINDDQLIGFVGFGTDWNKDGLEDFLKNFSRQIDEPARDALFKFNNGRVTAFSLEKKGRKLEKGKTGKNLLNCLDRLKNSFADHCLAEINLRVVEPKITAAETNRLGIKELVGRGESFFSGSPPARIDNIALAAGKLNGRLVSPGETFSFNKAVGEISKKTGYKSTYIISGGRTILGDGGGVCQVSTTLFRAALNAGLPVLERHAHAYRVHYYEEKSFLGLDATVFSPSVDIKFRNDLASYILIQTSFDRKNRHLVFDFFGTGDGRKAIISNKRVWDRSPPPPDLYTDDPSLPLGVVKQVDWRAWGAKASFDWRVVRNGEVIHKQTFFSYYRPWQAVFMRGTKKTT